MAHAFQRGIVNAILVSIPIMLAWLFTADGLILLGQDPWPGVQFVDGVQVPAELPGLGVSARD